MKTLGERIRELREELDISLREFARKLDVSAPFWSDVELGKRHPSDDTLREVARLLKASFHELKELDGRPPVDDLRRQTSSNPAMGLAFRRVLNAGFTPEELVRLADRKEAERKKK